MYDGVNTKETFTFLACARVMRHLATTERQLLDVMTTYRSHAIADSVTMLFKPKNPTPMPYTLQPNRVSK